MFGLEFQIYSSRPLLFRAVAQPVPGLPLLNLLVVELFDICLYLGIGCRHPLLFKEFLRPVPDQVLEKREYDAFYFSSRVGLKPAHRIDTGVFYTGVLVEHVPIKPLSLRLRFSIRTSVILFSHRLDGIPTWS